MFERDLFGILSMLNDIDTEKVFSKISSSLKDAIINHADELNGSELLLRPAYVFMMSSGRVYVSIDEKPVRSDNDWTIRNPQSIVLPLHKSLYPQLGTQTKMVETTVGAVFAKIKDWMENRHKGRKIDVKSVEQEGGTVKIDVDVTEPAHIDKIVSEVTVTKPEEKPEVSKVDKSDPLKFESFGNHMRNLLTPYQFLVDITTEFCKGNLNEAVFKKLLQTSDLQRGVFELVEFSKNEKLEDLNWREGK